MKYHKHLLKCYGWLPCHVAPRRGMPLLVPSPGELCSIQVPSRRPNEFLKLLVRSVRDALPAWAFLGALAASGVGCGMSKLCAWTVLLCVVV